MNDRPTALLALVLGLLGLGPVRALDATLFSTSVAVAPAETTSSGIRFRAAYTWTFDGSFNDELATGNPLAEESYSSFLRLTLLNRIDPLTGEPPVLDATADIGVPTGADSDTNGIPDFFQDDLPVQNVQLPAALYFDTGEEVVRGSMALTWNRAAGTQTGTVRINVRAMDFGINATFTHVFDIYALRGRVSYTREGDAARLVATGFALPDAALRLEGRIDLIRTNADELGFVAGTFTNQLGEVSAYDSSETRTVAAMRLAAPADAYMVPLYFPEGGPLNPGVPEYVAWQLRFRDPVDTDRDGVPDFSDEVVVAPPPLPSLRISLRGGVPVLTLIGEPGRAYAVDTSSSPAGFALLREVTPGPGGEAEVALPAVAGARFFRARLP